jgi:hypothetical protein
MANQITAFLEELCHDFRFVTHSQWNFLADFTRISMDSARNDFSGENANDSDWRAQFACPGSPRDQMAHNYTLFSTNLDGK